jgi:hypothetical protein
MLSRWLRVRLLSWLRKFWIMSAKIGKRWWGLAAKGRSARVTVTEDAFTESMVHMG